MKAEIHPTYYPDAKVTCASCGNTWTTGSTRKEIRVDICSNCHPFFTGESARQTYVEQQKVKEELKGSPERPIEELGLSSRAVDALKKAGIENFGQFLERLNGGNEAVLAIAGFGQASLTAAKKKLRSLGYELPEAAA